MTDRVKRLHSWVEESYSISCALMDLRDRINYDSSLFDHDKEPAAEFTALRAIESQLSQANVGIINVRRLIDVCLALEPKHEREQAEKELER